jgi:hypothetical protein
MCVVAGLACSACLDLSQGNWVFPCPGCDAGTPDSGPQFTMAPHLPWPQLINDGGAVISAPRLVTIATDGDPLAQNFFDLVDTVVTNPWLATVGGEYGVGAATSGGSYLGPALPFDGGTVSLSWSEMQSYVQGAIDAGVPAPNGQTAYLIFMPEGTQYEGAYESDVWAPFWLPGASSQGDFTAFIYRGSPLSGESQFDEMSVNATRVLINLLADPFSPVGPAWNLPVGTVPWQGSPLAVPGFGRSLIPTRAADLCDGARIEEQEASGPFALTRSWSNSAAARGGDPCIPAVGQPYYNVTFPQEWFEAYPGQTVSIPIVGWSTAAVADWSVYAYVYGGTEDFSVISTTMRLPITSPLGEEQVGNCDPLPGMNNGVTAQLQLTVPDAVVSGDYVTFQITSAYVDAELCSDPPPAAGDAKHEARFGVYVP